MSNDPIDEVEFPAMQLGNPENLDLWLPPSMQRVFSLLTLGQRVRSVVTDECQQEWAEGTEKYEFANKGHWEEEKGVTGVIVQIDYVMDGKETNHPFIVQLDEPIESPHGGEWNHLCFAVTELKAIDEDGNDLSVLQTMDLEGVPDKDISHGRIF